MDAKIFEDVSEARGQKVDVRIVDADAHVNPAPAMWAEYLAPQFRDLAPTLESDGEFDYVVFEGSRKKMIMLGANAGRGTKDFKGYGKLSDMRLGGWMAPQRLEDMDKDGIDTAILHGGGPLGTANFDLYIESFAAYNRWVSDFSSHDKNRLKFVGYIPMLDVDLAIKMMREAHAAGATAVNIPAFPQSKAVFNKAEAQAQALTGDATGSRQYRDAEFDPFWKAACDLDMPICFHLGARAPRFFAQENILPDMPLNRIAMLEMAGVMLFGGVFDRFPSLRIGLIESGIGWMSWAVHFHNRSWEMQRHWIGPKNVHRPSDYWEKNIYCSFVSDPVGVELRNHLGCKNIMWSSDYPHGETTFPHSQQVIADELAGVPAAERHWILAGCADKFYGISK